MSAAEVFAFVNVLPLPIWAIWILAPVLSLTLMAGPVGLLLYLAMRARLRRDVRAAS